MRLENWSVVVVDNDPYKAPELKKSHLHGKVFGHSMFPDGVVVTSSSIKGIDKDELIITNSGSHYQLGEVDPKYEEIFPNAKKRLIESLKKLM